MDYKENYKNEVGVQRECCSITPTVSDAVRPDAWIKQWPGPRPCLWHFIMVQINRNPAALLRSRTTRRRPRLPSNTAKKFNKAKSSIASRSSFFLSQPQLPAARQFVNYCTWVALASTRVAVVVKTFLRQRCPPPRDYSKPHRLQALLNTRWSKYPFKPRSKSSSI